MAMIKIAMDNQQIEATLQCQQFDMDKHFSFATDDDLTNKEAYTEFETENGSCIETAAKISNSHIITIAIDPNITWKKGTYKFNIVVYDETKTNRISYPTMRLKVNASANPNADAEGITALETTILRLKSSVTDAIATAETAIKNCNTATNNSQILYDKLKELTVSDYELRISSLETKSTELETKSNEIDNWKSKVLAGTETVLIEEG